MKRQVRTVLIVILAVIFVTAGIRLLAQQQDYREGKETYDEAAQIAGLSHPSPEPSASLAAAPKASEPSEEGQEQTLVPDQPPEESPEQSDAGEKAEEQVDLAALRQINPDVVGWISIPGTQLSYPLMQGTDNDYYLNHTWKKARSAVGSIYLDYRSSRDLSDIHTIIYGHRMSDGSMFNSLRHYNDLDYWKANPVVCLVTDTGTLRYEIFAAYEADVAGGHTYSLDLEDTQAQQAYLDASLRASVIETGVVPEPGERIITLSTCVSMGRDYDTRWVVQAVLKEDT